MKVIVENCVFMNGGDSAINHATRQILEKVFPGVEIAFADSGHPAIAAYYPDFRIIPLPSFEMDRAPAIRLARKILGRYRKFFLVRRAYMAISVVSTRVLTRLGLPLPTPTMRAIKNYLSADFVLSQGGTYIVSKYDYSHRVLEFYKDRQLGLPLASFTQSFEPFTNDFKSRALAPTLKEMEIILVRHEASRKAVEDLIGSAKNVVVAADAVFAMWHPGPTGVIERRARAGRLPDDRLRIAIAVRKLKSYGEREYDIGRDTFRDSIRAAVVSLVRDKGAAVTFVSTCQGIPEYWTDDSAVATNFVANLPADVLPHVSVDRSFHTPPALIDKLQGFDGVIACRLHAAILSICANTPVLPVSYEAKFEETFCQLGVPELITRIGEIEPDRFVDTVLDWVERLDAVGAVLADAAPGIKASAESAGPELKRALAKIDLC